MMRCGRRCSSRTPTCSCCATATPRCTNATCRRWRPWCRRWPQPCFAAIQVRPARSSGTSAGVSTMREVDAAALLSFTRMPDLPLARRWMCARLRAAAAPPPVLAAMEVIPRHCFAPVRWRVGYAELSFWTGTAWMLSPATVARVAGALPELSGARVLEIGTGSGYQTALLSMLGAEVVSLDASQGCLSEARGRLKALGTPAVVEQSDGDAGYDGETRYDAIVVN